jgi:Kef-type K+ transport system membrane component KefB
VRQVFILLALLSILAATAAIGDRVHPNLELDANTLTATGFILLAAYGFGELFRRFRLPALLGYLATGMLFGPSLASLALGDSAHAPIDKEALDQLSLVNLLAVGVIGTMGGGEIRIDDLRGNFRKVASITVVVFLMVLPVVTGLVLALAYFAPTLIPFLAEIPAEGRIAAALLFGVLAVGMSPSATLALLLEVRATGRFTSLVLGVVVLADLVLVATFLIVLALAKLLVSPEGVSADRMFEVLPHIGAEFGWAILLGLLLGLAFIAYLRVVRRELLLFSLGIIFITSFVASRLHAETLLAFLVGGFVVQNFSKHGHTLIEAFERIALPVFVIYFTTQAATLDLVAFTAYLPLTLLLVVTRVALFFYGIGAAARLARVDDEQRRLLRISFFSQGGVDLVLAALIAEAIPGWGVEVQTVTIATILIYVVVGPPLLARALDRAGESAAARERGAEELASRPTDPKAAAHPPTFGVLETGSGPLDARLQALRELITTRVRELARDTTAAHQRRTETIEALASRVTATLDASRPLEDPELSDRVDPSRLLLALDEADAAIVSASAQWDETGYTPLPPSRLQEMFAHILGAVDFSTSHRVTREPALFEFRGSGVKRIVRLLRRLRRALFGPGMRTVPVGRLWRYHVALDVPVALWGSVKPWEREAWSLLLAHYRLTRRAIEDISAGRRPVMEIDLQQSLSGGHAAHSGTHASHSGTHAMAEPAGAGPGGRDELAVRVDASVLGLEVLGEAHAAAVEREAALRAALRDRDLALERSIESAFAAAWSAFLDSAASAGTWDYPAWRYRVSSRYDAAQAATAELRDRLARDLEGAAGIRDALAALAHTSRFVSETRAAMQSVRAQLTAEAHACAPRIEEALEACTALHEAGEESRLDREVVADVSSRITDLATALDRVARRLDRAETLAGRGSELARALAHVPEALEPIPLHRLQAGDDRAPAERSSVALRAWLDHAITRDLTFAALDARAELVEHIKRIGVMLDHARQVFEYHLLASAGGGALVDENVAERASAILGRARTDLYEALGSTEHQLTQRLEAATKRGALPALGGRWDEIARQVRRLDDAAAGRAALAEWARERVRKTKARASRSLRAIRDEVAAVFGERTTPHESAEYRRLLFGPASTMTDAYQRLFTSVPAENVGLVLDRPEVIEPVMAGIERWLQGRGGPILIRGDRGVGKRTLIRDVSAKLGERLDTRWISLTPEMDAEPEVAQSLAQLLGWPSATDFRELERGRRSRAKVEPSGHRTAVVIANVERLFRRTPAGLDRVRRFFDLVAATSTEVLWIVLFAEPAARLLGPILELEGRFPVMISVPPMTARQLESSLMMRHRLSGYELRFVEHSPSLHEWVRSPASAGRARGAHGIATYDRLRVLCGGNVRQAQRLWLAAARLDDDGSVVVGPIDAMSDALLEDLPLVSRVLLAALLLHGPLHREELAAVTLRQGHALDAEITHLQHLGFISVVSPATAAWAHPEDGYIQVNTRLVAPLTEELRQCNLL